MLDFHVRFDVNVAYVNVWQELKGLRHEREFNIDVIHDAALFLYT